MGRSPQRAVRAGIPASATHRHPELFDAAGRPRRRGALLASTAFTGAFIAVIAGHPQGALAACSGVNTANVLCDAANQATGGTLNTTFSGSTVVNVNPGGKIDTGGAAAVVTLAGNLAFNHNDTTFGIVNGGGVLPGVGLNNVGSGGVTYTGNANVTGAGGGITANASASGDVTITNNATVTATTQGVGIQGVILTVIASGNILINGSGNASGPQLGIGAFHFGKGNITISGSGNTTGGMQANISSSTNPGNILINRSGAVSGGVLGSTAGTGSVTVAGDGPVAGTNGQGIMVTHSNNAVGTNGSLTVGGSGDVSTTVGVGIGAQIFGANNSGSITVSRIGNVTGSVHGITALTAGRGSVMVTGTGNVSGSNGFGIRAESIGGSVLVAQVGTVSGSVHGIRAAAFGAGALTVTTSSNVTGATLDGLDTFTQSAPSSITVAGGTVSGAQSGIVVASGTGSANVTVDAGATVQGGVRGVSFQSPTGTLLNNGTIRGNTAGINTTGGSTAVTNAGSVTGTGGTAVSFLGANNLFVMDGPGATLGGNAIGSGTDTFRLAGSGANSFNVGQIGAGWTLFDKAGPSTWTVTGTSTYGGPTTVSAGTLLVNGSLASSNGVTVASGASLGGGGTVPNTTINAGGALAPGNSIGTISIGGNLTFVGAGNYVVEVAPASADRTNATGTAALSGTLRAVGTGGMYTVGARYTVLNATGGISGTFGSLAISGNFGATRPHIEYDANNVYIVLDQNTISPFLIGGTPNQRTVAGAIDTALLAGSQAAPFLALFGLTAAQLPGALDQLSGEVHASTAGVLADESRIMRDAVLGRLRQASYGGEASMASLSVGGPVAAFADGEIDSALAYGKSPIVTKAPRMVAPSYDVTFWAQGFGARGRFETDGNAATLRRDLAGFISGVDTRVGGNGRLGVAAGYTGSRNALDGRGTADVETAHIAGYGGWSFGAFNLRAGAAYAFHSIATDRLIAFPGFFDRTTANYDGHTGQIFGELGYGFALGNLAIEPFAGAAWVRVKTDAAAERGGAAALNFAGTTFETGYATLGIRAAGMIALGHDMMLVPRATLAWQHAFDNVTPAGVLAFQAAPVPFTIAGVPIARDSLLAEAGLDLAIGRHATLGVSYVGQLASNVQDHAAKGKFSWKF